LVDNEEIWGTGVKKPLSLPTVPLTEDGLAPLADHNDVVAVYVFPDRATDVILAGLEAPETHSGDILHFWIEQEDEYRKVCYEPADDGMGWAWHAAPEPVEKTSDTGAKLAKYLQETHETVGGEQ
jgi:hypothetical protein